MLISDIQNDLKEAQKAQDGLRLSVLRFLLSEIYNKRIDLKLDEGQEISDEEVITIIRHQAKQRNESIEAFKSGNRPELVEKEQKELEILSLYLPKMMPKEEIEKIVDQIIAENFKEKKPLMSDFGKVMGMAMGKVKGQADGTSVSSVVREKLS